ncbi:hypothetical protein MBLNU457_1340t1 [Dothideomycetes sp. NU457]
MADRRRINPPAGGTSAPLFALPKNTTRPTRTRSAAEPRKIFLQTGLVPSASGSAYLELQPTTPADSHSSLLPPSSTLKLTCTVHGPRPLPRSSPFSSTLVLNTHVKFAPFASRSRRGYVRDAAERDLGAHLETALRGVVIGERWPKSGCEVLITVLEGEDDGWFGEGKDSGEGWGMMNVLAGCITAASAAIADAGIDCVDLIAGGVAALPQGEQEPVLDPCFSEHEALRAACVVGYLQSRDEITELWMRGDAGKSPESLIDKAVEAAMLTRTVLAEAVKEAADAKYQIASEDANASTNKSKDVEMKG